MMRLRLKLLCSAVVMVAGSLVVSGCSDKTTSPTNVAPSESAMACDDSIRRNFKPDALTTVVMVKQFKKGNTLALQEEVTPFTPKAQNDLCLVKLVVGPGNPGPEGEPSTSAGIGLEIWLPPKDDWNGRIHNIGGRGGFDGGGHTSTTEIGWFFAGATAGSENSVSGSSDMGHSGSGGAFGMNPDRTLASQLWIDYAHRAQHELAVKTKALVKAYYGRDHSYAYYEGSSSGGRHGYSLAQRYPDDYDGILANLPAVNFVGLAMAAAYKNLVIMNDLDGIPLTEGQQDLASNAAINACDVVGGEHLGYIMDNEACNYDPSTDKAVLCKSAGGINTSSDCLSLKQATAINKWWYGPTADGSVPDPAVDNGAGTELGSSRLWYGYMRGTSLYNVFFTKIFKMIKIPGVSLGSTLPESGVPEKAQLAASAGGFGGDVLALVLGDPTLAGENFHNASGNGEGRYLEMSYADLAHAFVRAKELNHQLGGLATDNPDMSAFKARGGKIIGTHGWNDEAIPVQTSTRYFESVVRWMGMDQVNEFYRLYLVPGGGHESPHGTSNPSANPPRIGSLYPQLVAWVEQGVAPGRIDIASPVPGPTAITQPVCPYPQRAVYTTGNPRVASSYQCQ